MKKKMRRMRMLLRLILSKEVLILPGLRRNSPTLTLQSNRRWSQNWNVLIISSHSPNLPYSEGIGSLAAAIPVLKVV